MGEKPTVITAEDLELHNEAGGSWTIVSGKVYDLELAEVREPTLVVVVVVVYKLFTDMFVTFFNCYQVLSFLIP